MLFTNVTYLWQYDTHVCILDVTHLWQLTHMCGLISNKYHNIVHTRGTPSGYLSVWPFSRGILCSKFFFGNCHTCVTFCMHATFNKFKFSHNKKIRTGRCMCTRWTPCTCWKKIHTVWLYESISSTKHFTKQLYIPHSTKQYTTFFCLFACTNYDACLLPAHVQARNLLDKWRDMLNTKATKLLTEKNTSSEQVSR